jgi:hypothetical protein
MKKYLFFTIVLFMMAHALFIAPVSGTMIRRAIINDSTCAPAIAISVTPTESILTYAFKETLPFGLTPLHINENGKWHPEIKQIRWGNFRDHTVRSFTYELTGLNGAYEIINSIFSADGHIQKITETATVSIQCTSTQDPNNPWEEETPLDPVAAPIFLSDSSEVPSTLSITCTTQDAAIFFTTDGSRPTTASQQYTGTITISAPAFIRAIAMKSGMQKSATQEILFYTPELESIKAERILVNDESCAPSIVIHVTPAENTLTYAMIESLPAGLTPYNINENGNFNIEKQTIRWGNFRDNSSRSFSYDLTGVNGAYDINQMTFSEDGTSYLIDQSTHVNMNCSVNDNEDPHPPDPEPEIISTPIFHTSSDSETQQFSITCETTDTVIYYTTDGSRPTKDALVYSTPISLTNSTQIRAIAIKDDMFSSITSQLDYSISSTTPVFGDISVQLEDDQTCYPMIIVSVMPENDIRTYALEVSIPNNLSVFSISDGGMVNYTKNSIRWGNFRDHASRDFTFRMEGNNQQGTIRGVIGFDGYLKDIPEISVEVTCDEENKPPFITVAPMHNTISAQNTAFSLTINNEKSSYTVMNWDVIPQSDWITVKNNPTGINNGVSLIQCTMNPQPDWRTGNILIQSNEAINEHQIVQVLQMPNKRPSIQVRDTFTLFEDQPGEITFTVSDPESSFDDLIITTELSCPQFASMTLLVHPQTSAAILEVEPKPNQYGSCPMAITVTDQTYTVSEQLMLTIIEVNDPPEISGIPDQSTSENRAIPDVPFTINDIETHANDLNIHVGSSDTDLIANNNITIFGIGENKTLHILPSTDRVGHAMIIISIADAQNATAVTSFNVSVYPNMPPVAVGETLFLDEDKFLYILLKATDTEDDPLSYTWVQPPAHGQLTIENDIAIYTPHLNYNTMDRFSFKANDSFSDSNTADIVLTIYPIDDPPVAIDLSFQTTENKSLSFSFPLTDVDGEILTHTIVDPPKHGSLSETSQSLTYQPETWFWGTDTMVYTLTDGHTVSSTATVTITINQADEYTLSLDYSNEIGEIEINGTTVLLPWQGSFAADSKVTLKAITTSDDIFEFWQGDVEHPTENPLIVTMNRGKSISVRFMPPKKMFKLLGYQSINIHGGTFSLPLEKVFYRGDQISLKALPLNIFKGWSGDITGTQNPIDIEIQNHMTVGVLFSDSREWAATITAEAIELSPIQTDEITIGVSLLSQKIPDELPNEYGCSLLIYSPDWDKNSTDIREFNTTEYSWMIAVNPHGNIGSPESRTTFIRWNPQHFSDKGFFRMYRGYDQTGDCVVEDMRTLAEFAVTGIESVQIFNIVWSMKEATTAHINTQAGWNLISLPVTPKDSHISVLFPDASIAYEYKDGAYINVDQLVPGTGYWLKTTSSTGYDITGEAFQSYTNTFHPGCHLIGAVFEAVDNPYSEDCVEVIFRYQDGAYAHVSELVPGCGYWIKVKKECVLKVENCK